VPYTSGTTSRSRFVGSGGRLGYEYWVIGVARAASHPYSGLSGIESMDSTLRPPRPPIVELVLGAQFSPLTKLTAGHLGWFWRQLGDEWAHPRDDAPLDDQFESFGAPLWERSHLPELRLGEVEWPGRLLIEHRGRDRLLQLQKTRFILNWRRRADDYPSYDRLVAEFQDLLGRFAAFATDAALGEISINQWEISYVDAFPHDEFWDTPADWGNFLPGLFATPSAAPYLVLENRLAEWTYEIPPKRGRLHIKARSIRPGDQEAAVLLLQTTARGPVGEAGSATLREGLDLGHEAAVESFYKLVSPEIRERCGAQA